jgi:hypothetical protein
MYTKFWSEKSEGKKPLGRPRRKREDNIRTNLRKIRWECVNWINLARNRDQWLAPVNTVMNFGMHKSIEFLD